MRRFLVFLLALFIGASLPGADAEYRMVCYFESWAESREPNGTFAVEQIDPTLCTHLIYAFANVSGNDVDVGDAAIDLEDNGGSAGYKRFNQLKQRNPKLKTMIAVGGWKAGSQGFSDMACTDDNRKEFAKNAASFVMKYGFDGLDVDWEYPNQFDGSKPEDVQNFVSLLKELRTEFDKYGLILSAAVGATEDSVNTSYDVPKISQYLSFINLMTYDLHLYIESDSSSSMTGNNAGLYPSATRDITNEQKQLNVKACVDIWLKKGADPKKINLGMPLYGRSYTLESSRNTGINSAASGPGNKGVYTDEEGVLGYNEIVELQRKGGWTTVWDDEQMVPYMYNGNQWVSYDDLKSLILKVELAKKMGLGGGMVWSIDTDDFNGIQTGVKNPLLKAINNAFGTGIPIPAPSTTSTAKSTTSTTKTTTTTTTTRPPAPPSTTDPASLCKVNYSYVRDPKVCSKFYLCMIVYGQFKAYEYNCAPGLNFDPKIIACNWPSQVNCVN